MLEFAGKEVHDVPLNDRIKILRGGMEGIDNIHTPSASDMRLTDDEGLKLAVESLQKDPWAIRWVLHSRSPDPSHPRSQRPQHRCCS